MHVTTLQYMIILISVEPLTLSTPQHKPRSVSAYGRRRGSVAGAHSVHDFKTVKNDGNHKFLKILQLINIEIVKYLKRLFDLIQCSI